PALPRRAPRWRIPVSRHALRAARSPSSRYRRWQSASTSSGGLLHSGPVGGIAGHQVIGMFPAGQDGDAPEPAVDVRPVGTGEAEGLGVVEIAAAREVGDRGVCPRDPVAVLKMALERLEG